MRLSVRIRQTFPLAYSSACLARISRRPLRFQSKKQFLKQPPAEIRRACYRPITFRISRRTTRSSASRLLVLRHQGTRIPTALFVLDSVLHLPSRQVAPRADGWPGQAWIGVLLCAKPDAKAAEPFSCEVLKTSHTAYRPYTVDSGEGPCVMQSC